MIYPALLSLAALTAGDPVIPWGEEEDQVAVSGLFGARLGSDDAADPIALDAARLRLFLPTEAASVQMELEMASGVPTFLDAQLRTEVQGVQTLLGRFETPLTRSRLIERERLLFLDRSLVGGVSGWLDGVQFSERGERMDWWLALQDGTNGASDGLTATARVALHLIGGGSSEDTEGAWGSPGRATLTLAGAFQDDSSYEEGRRAAFEALWTYDLVSASFEILDNDADVGDSSPWSAMTSCLVAPRMEAALRLEDLEDDEFVKRTTIALTRYLQTRSSRSCLELGKVDAGPSTGSSTVLSAGVSFSF